MVRRSELDPVLTDFRCIAFLNVIAILYDQIALDIFTPILAA